MTREELINARILTFRQPWATLIALGYKDIEIRNWSPLKQLARETSAQQLYKEITTGGMSLLIHAGSLASFKKNLKSLPLVFWLQFDFDEKLFLEKVEADCGNIIAECKLSEIKSYYIFEDFNADCRRHRNPSDWFSGTCYGWVFTNIRRVDPILAKGQLGLWKLSDKEIEAALTTKKETSPLSKTARMGNLF